MTSLLIQDGLLHHTFFIDIPRGQAAKGFTAGLSRMFKKMGYVAASISFQEKKIVGGGKNTPEKKANTTKSKSMMVSKAIVLGCPPKWDLGAMGMQGFKTVRCFGVPGSTAANGQSACIRMYIRPSNETTATCTAIL